MAAFAGGILYHRRDLGDWRRAIAIAIAKVLVFARQAVLKFSWMNGYKRVLFCTLFNERTFAISGYELLNFDHSGRYGEFSHFDYAGEAGG